MLRKQALRPLVQVYTRPCILHTARSACQSLRVLSSASISATPFSAHNRPPCTSLRRDFHATPCSYAQSPTADALMENLTELYAAAKDEFEIAAEETEKKTVYAAEDREAAKEALNLLKEAYEKALKESDPNVAKEVQSRTGPRIRELENAVTAMEEMAMED